MIEGMEEEMQREEHMKVHKEVQREEQMIEGMEEEMQEIKEQSTETQSIITLTPQHRLFSEEQMEIGQSITPEHFLSQLLGGEHIASLKRKRDHIEDNIGDGMSGEDRSGFEDLGAGSSKLLLDAAANDIE